LYWALAVRVAPPRDEPAIALTPIQQRQQELLEANVGRPGDPDLMAQFAATNIKYFRGALPMIPVRWEPRLAEVGKLAAQAFTLEGLFGRLGGDVLILINPDVRRDPRALERALCHEMVHFHLFTTGDMTTNHGPPFKAVLARLAQEGAFEGLAGTEQEKSRLRAWLDAESTRLDMDQIELERIGQDIAQERDAIEEQAAILNRRVAEGDRPEAAEIDGLERRRQRFNDIVVEANARIERGRQALAHFNAEVARYNLMLVYPDGIDEEQRVAQRTASR
jgi:hypothetical protein